MAWVISQKASASDAKSVPKAAGKGLLPENTEVSVGVKKAKSVDKSNENGYVQKPKEVCVAEPGKTEPVTQNRIGLSSVGNDEDEDVVLG
jgi:hypothetical protein